MALEIKIRKSEAGSIVTIRTIPVGTGRKEFPLVKICMAIHAFCKGDRVGHASRFMAFLTLQAQVFSLQRKAGQRMVKFLVGFEVFKAVLVVTGGAIQAKPAFMRVPMAVDTTHLVQVGKLPQWPRRTGAVVVTFPAIQVAVAAFQSISGQTVVKTGTWDNFFKGSLYMAAFAGVAVLSLVRIFMTGNTALEINPLEFLKIPLAIGFHRMAGFAVHFLMSTRQRKPGLAVIKKGGGLPAFKSVAFLTIVGQGIPVSIGMAGQTVGLQAQKSIGLFL